MTDQPDPYPHIYGIDVYEKTKFADPAYSLVGNGEVKFAWIKCTEGATRIDTQRSVNFRYLREGTPGIRLGGYHYAYPQVEKRLDKDVDGEVDYFCEKLESVPGQFDLPPVLDWEHWDSEEDKGKGGIYDMSLTHREDWILRFLAGMKHKGYPEVVIYSTEYLLKRSFKDPVRTLMDIPLWIAWYPEEDGHFYPAFARHLPFFRKPEFGHCVAWQYTPEGKVPGISSNVDVSVAVDHHWFGVRGSLAGKEGQ